MKKLLISLLSLCLLIITLSPATMKSQQTFSMDAGVSTDIIDEVDSQLDKLDFSEFDKILSSMSIGQKSLFGEGSFINKVKSLISGEFDSSKTFFQNVLSILFDSLLSFLPIMSLIVAISLLGNMLNGIKPSGNTKSISNIVNFVSFGVVVVLVLSIVVKMIALTTDSLHSIQSQMNSVFPLLLTLLSAIGGTTAASIYQPAMGLLAGTIINFFTYILLPLFIFSVVFSVISNLSNTIKLDKFSSFCNSTFKWSAGLVFTIFTAFMSLQGITAGSIDGISIRTAKYAIRSHVPILGSYISDGMGIILASSNLIKNAVGVAGLLMMIASILTPLIEMIVFMLALKLIAGIIEPLGNKQISSFVSSLSKSMVLLIVLLIGAGFAYFILLGLVMCTANVF